MRRKVAKGCKRKLDGRRRSPRLSAMEACKSQQPNRLANEVTVERDFQPPPRARKRRKLKPLKDVAAKSLKAGEKDGFEDDPSHNDQLTGSPLTSCMPDKRILELILDILQRRDTHELFAEPVDPVEVEGYYEIIKEPMDFGTMRAKLHEGMYSSVEQFERDVFLISRNAMEFNSSATIYFRQARAIHELAKRVLHSLKTDPKAFESENLHRRRRSSGRILRGDARASRNSSSSKISENLKLDGKETRESSKPILYSNVSSNREKAVKSDSMASCGSVLYNYEMFSGGHGGKESSFSEMDRRSTYRPWMSFLNGNKSIASMIYNHSKRLMPVGLTDTGYKESLKLFTKDLGPTAHKVAERKLFGWPNSSSQSPRSHNQCVSTSTHLRPNIEDNSIIMPTCHDLSDPFCMLRNMVADTYQCKADNMIKETSTNGNLLSLSSPTICSSYLSWPQRCQQDHPYTTSACLRRSTADSATISLTSHDSPDSVCMFGNTGGDMNPLKAHMEVETHFNHSSEIMSNLKKNPCSLRREVQFTHMDTLNKKCPSLSGDQALNCSYGGSQKASNMLTAMILDESKNDDDDKASFFRSLPNQARQANVSFSGSGLESSSLSLWSVPNYSQMNSPVQKLSTLYLDHQALSREDGKTSVTVPKFSFDLQYLKARLGPNNSTGQDMFARRVSLADDQSSEETRQGQRSAKYNHQSELIRIGP